jgi:transposase-like protein
VVRGSDRGHRTASGLHRAAAARRFLERAIDLHGEPQKITIDKRPANAAAVTGYPDSTWTRAEGGA